MLKKNLVIYFNALWLCELFSYWYSNKKNKKYISNVYIGQK